MEKQSTVVIEGRDLSIGYRNGKHTSMIHEHLDFCLHRGRLTCMLGANGVGKSTLLRTLSASQPQLSGSLELFGRPIDTYSERELSRLVGVVLTDKTQAGGLTVYELVALGRQPHTGFFGRLRRADKLMIEHALEQVGVADKSSRYVAELSDGERQKVMIAKALVQECPVILLDEPTAFLDIVSCIDIMILLHRLAREDNKAILLSTHNVEQSLVIADSLWLLTRADGLECGVTEDLILNNRMDTLFAEKKRNVHFDLMHGVFSPGVNGRRSICLKTDDEVLKHWTQNALNRMDYFCLSSENSDASLPLLEVKSAHDFVLSRNSVSKTFNSFEELIEALR